MIVRKIGKVVALRGTLLMVGFILPLIITSLTDVTAAAEKIPDWELTELYGGHVLYYNPYCGAGNDCEDVGCVDPADNCCVCIHFTGRRCYDGWSTHRDENGCTTTTELCPSGCKEGYCHQPGFCDSKIVLDPPFPDCNEDYRQMCYD